MDAYVPNVAQLNIEQSEIHISNKIIYKGFYKHLLNVLIKCKIYNIFILLEFLPVYQDVQCWCRLNSYVIV